MKNVHIDNVPWFEWTSPTGKFAGAGRQVSEALGGIANATIAEGGHPFDLEIGKLAPGKSCCPFHRHSAQWECYYILSGSGVMRHGDQRRELKPGDIALHPPGSSHQIINRGETDLTYYLVADNPLTEYCYYPDSNKWGLMPAGIILRGDEVDYNLGEDETSETTTSASKLPLPETPAQFLNIADLQWEHRRSPQGKFESRRADISLTLGAPCDAGVQVGGHPFDLQLRKIPAGAAICPYHSHSAQWELFIFTAGHGFVRTPEGKQAVGPGDIVLHPPGSPHQSMAAADNDLECLIITDNPPEDFWRYPDADKCGVCSESKFYRLTEADYFDGEE